VTSQPTLFLMVGLPATGKSTVAREIESTHRALRLSPDEWMIPLFGESDADGRRDLLEGLLIDVAVRALHLGMNVILDFGLWGRDERTALRTLGEAAGARVVLRYVDVDEEAQARRIGERWAADPRATFPMSPTDLVRWRTRSRCRRRTSSPARTSTSHPPVRRGRSGRARDGRAFADGG